MGHNLGNNYGKFYSFQSKPVILDAKWTVSSTDTGGNGTINVRGQGIKNVFMHTSATPSASNPNPASGYILIELAYNYTRVYGGPWNVRPPVTGGNLAINGSALTAGLPYQIVSVGVGTAGSATIQPIADVSGSLASTWFKLFDAYGNTFIIWFKVSGVGSAPSGVSGTLVQQSISTNDTAATIGTALVTTIQNLPSGISGVNSFTASGTTTVTVTSTTTTPLAGPPADGVIPTGFTFNIVNFTTNLSDWQHVGVPKGVTPAVDVSFIATAAGYSTGGGSTGLVKALTTSGITDVEILGDPNLSLAPIPIGGSPNSGGWILLQTLAPSSSSVTTRVPTAPADGSIFYMQFLLEQAARVGGNNE